MWQCKAQSKGLIGKILSFGLAETISSTCTITDSRLVYKTTGTNCRGKRKEWELSVPLSVVHSVLWTNYYQKVPPDPNPDSYFDVKVANRVWHGATENGP